jgi:DNA-directed RNA polymerase specialized sigma24 family protein
MSAIRDQQYAAVVNRERPLIHATAYLLTGDPAQADRLVQLAFAQLYERWPKVRNPQVEMFRAVVDAARSTVQLPWEPHARVELIDGPQPLPATEPIVADLQALRYDQRVAIVLERYAEFPIVQIAEILERPVHVVPFLVRQAQAALADEHPERADHDALAQELREAIPYDVREPHSSAEDLAHGQRLARRRWLQRGSAAAAAVLLIIVAVGLLLPTRQPVPQAAPSVPISTPSSRDCHTAAAACRSQILLKWRSEMAQVAASHLDPKGRYFSGFGYAYDSRYDMPSFWSGQGGALAFEMFRLPKGATEVYIQVATSDKFAVRCGATTHQRCLSFHSMDGNSYLVTDSTLADAGIEIQYWPTDDEVITVIARNSHRGAVLEISSGDLIKLVQDERLRLPKR